MHDILEIIMPKSENIKESINKIMDYFIDEDNEYSDWYDFYVIGGRFSGFKRESLIDKDKLEKFNDKLKELKITVSSFTAGKQQLNPPEQIPIVDNLWKEMFPETGLDVCPLFNHFNNQYEDSIEEDVWSFKDIPLNLKVSRVIIANEDKPVYMIQDEFWNGVTHIKTNWDGTIKHALELFKKRCKNYNEEYKKQITPKDDWMCITVDYHN